MKRVFVALWGVAMLVVPRLIFGQTCTASGPVSGTGANDASSGTVAWTNPANAVGTTTDGSYAIASAATISLFGNANSNYLTMTNLGFSLPPSNTVCGVVVTVNRRSVGLITLGTVTDNDVRLTEGGTLFTGSGANHAQGGTWSNTPATVTYGSNTDTWGAVPLTPGQVNSTSFGVALSVHLQSLVSVAFSGQVDNITVTVYSSTAIILPIDLQSFTATRTEGGVLLAWTTGATGPAGNSGRQPGTAIPGLTGNGSSQTSNGGTDPQGSFAVERSSDSKTWTTLSTVTAVTGQSAYQYTDTDPLPGTAYYRLHLLNSNGSSSYSIVAGIATRSVAYIRCYPNPFANVIHVSSSRPIGKVLLKDIQGRTLQIDEPGPAIYDLDLPTPNLPPGVYFLQVDGLLSKIIKRTW